MKRFIKYFLCLLISLCVFAGTGCGFDIFGSGSGSGAGSDAPLIIRMLDIGQGDAILIERNGKFALIDTGVERQGETKQKKPEKRITAYWRRNTKKKQRNGAKAEPIESPCMESWEP